MGGLVSIDGGKGTVKFEVAVTGGTRTRTDEHPVLRSAPSHFQNCMVKVWYGVGCQIHRQAGHGAAHSLATCLEAAELIQRPAKANAQFFFENQLSLWCPHTQYTAHRQRRL